MKLTCCHYTTPQGCPSIPGCQHVPGLDRVPFYSVTSSGLSPRQRLRNLWQKRSRLSIETRRTTLLSRIGIVTVNPLSLILLNDHCAFAAPRMGLSLCRLCCLVLLSTLPDVREIQVYLVIMAHCIACADGKVPHRVVNRYSLFNQLHCLYPKRVVNFQAE